MTTRTTELAWNPVRLDSLPPKDAQIVLVTRDDGGLRCISGSHIRQVIANSLTADVDSGLLFWAIPEAVDLTEPVPEPKKPSSSRWFRHHANGFDDHSYIQYNLSTGFIIMFSAEDGGKSTRNIASEIPAWTLGQAEIFAERGIWVEMTEDELNDYIKKHKTK